MKSEKESLYYLKSKKFEELENNNTTNTQFFDTAIEALEREHSDDYVDRKSVIRTIRAYGWTRLSSKSIENLCKLIEEMPGVIEEGCTCIKCRKKISKRYNLVTMCKKCYLQYRDLETQGKEVDDFEQE